MQTKRDGKDYESISSVTHMLNNVDSVLKKDDVKEAIEDYEDLFAGARTEVRGPRPLQRRLTMFEQHTTNRLQLCHSYREYGCEKYTRHVFRALSCNKIQVQYSSIIYSGVYATL